MSSPAAGVGKRTIVCIDNLKREHEVDITELKWRPTTCGFVVKDGKLLLSKQFNGFALPGGGIDLGEQPEDCVLREIKEETGIIAINPRLVTVVSTFFKPADVEGYYYQSLILYYQCDYAGGELSADGIEEDEKSFVGMPEWIALDKLDGIEISSTDDFRKHLGLLR